MKKTWPYLRIIIPPSLEETVTAVLFACGCSGTASELIGPAEDRAALPRLTAWFPDSGSRDEAAGRLRGLFGGVEPADPLLIEAGSQESEDWLARWREGLQPFQVGRRFLLVPGDDDPDEGLRRDRHVLRITPGLAFGTGHHETTRFCLEQLEASAGDGVDFLDVGTGSGILSVAAALLGCRRVVGTEIDPETAVVASANIARHGLAGRVNLLVAGTPVAAGRRPFPLVAANILGGTLIRLAPVLSGPLLGDGGRLLLAGILAGSEEREVVRAYLDRGLQCLLRKIDGEWAGLVMSKTSG